MVDEKIDKSRHLFRKFDFCSFFRKVRSIYYVEVLVLLFNLGQGLRASANFPLFYNKVCSDLYNNEQSHLCKELKKHKQIENTVQGETATWLMYNEIVTFLPYLLSATFFGSYGDKYGQKVPTLVALCSLICHTFLYMLFASWSQVPVYSLIIEAGVTALLGGKTVFVAAQYAQAANQTENKSKLSKRYAILTACLSGAIFVSGMLSPLLMKFMSLIYLQLLGEIVTTVCFFAALLLYVEPDILKKSISVVSSARSVEPSKEEPRKFLPETIPQKLELAQSQPTDDTLVYTITTPKMTPKLSIIAESDSDSAENESLARRRAIDMSPTCLWKPSVWPETPPSTPPENAPKPNVVKKPKKSSSLLSWLKKLKEVYYLAWQTMTKKRTSHRRCHLFTWCIVGLIYSCADSGMDTVTALYVYHEPLSWTPSGYSLWMASMNVVQMLSGLVGIHIMKKFDICDYKIVMIGLLSMTMKMMCTGSATRNFVMYLSIVFGCLSNIGLSSLRAIVANLGSADETGRLVSTISIVMGWSPLVSSIVFNNVYKATLDFYTGTTFILISALLVLCLITVLFLYYDSEHQMKKKLRKVKTEEVAAVWHIQSITSRRESVIYS